MNLVCFATAALVAVAGFSAFGQQPAVSSPTPLPQLLAEAEANNPQIPAADHEARAARQMEPQVTTLPDPKVTYQQFSVGSPKRFAGYTNSDFSYIGIGASQELPYPGKLGLRGRVAERDADAKQAEVDVTKTSIANSIKADYIQLGVFPTNAWHPATERVGSRPTHSGRDRALSRWSGDATGCLVGTGGADNDCPRNHDAPSTDGRVAGPSESTPQPGPGFA